MLRSLGGYPQGPRAVRSQGDQVSDEGPGPKLFAPREMFSRSLLRDFVSVTIMAICRKEYGFFMMVT